MAENPGSERRLSTVVYLNAERVVLAPGEEATDVKTRLERAMQTGQVVSLDATYEGTPGTIVVRGADLSRVLVRQEADGLDDGPGGHKVGRPSGHKVGGGWLRDLPDRRDLTFRGTVESVPQRVDLREEFGDFRAYDQGLLESCSAHAIAGAFQFLQRKAGTANGFTPSRLYIYYREREREGTLETDSGATLRTGIKVLNRFGAPPEDDWPYEVARFAEAPPSSLDTKAEQFQALTYRRVERDFVDPTRGIMSALTSGYAVIFGFSVYESYRDAEESGRWPLPGPGERVEFGHAALIVGYEPVDGRPHAICRNSWGAAWGERGYFRMPMEYLVNPGLSDDFWVITSLG